jgi:hypothetical protein
VCIYNFHGICDYGQIKLLCVFNALVGMECSIDILSLPHGVVLWKSTDVADISIRRGSRSMPSFN